MIDNLRRRIEELKKKIREFLPENESVIKDEIKSLYIDITNALKSLTQIQEDLWRAAQDFKYRKSSKVEAERFYSLIKSRTSAELDISTLLDRAWNLICVEDYTEAIKALKEVLEIDPKNVRGLDLMALILMHKELYDEAMLYLQQVLNVEPANPFALNNLGFICYKKGIWGEAIEHLTKAAKQKKDRMASLYANFYLGVVYFERSMITDAIKFFEEAYKLGPNLQEVYYYLGLAETKRYEFKRAVEYFEKCIKIDPNSRYGKLCAEELNKIKPLTEPTQIFKRNRQDDKTATE